MGNSEYRRKKNKTPRMIKYENNLSREAVNLHPCKYLKTQQGEAWSKA